MGKRNVKERRREIVEDFQDGGKAGHDAMELVAKCKSPVHVLGDYGGEDQSSRSTISCCRGTSRRR